ncbi:MAG: MFS transporter [Anaerolineaceae bacterium]
MQKQNTLWLMLSALLIGTLIGTMGNSIVSIALPSLMDYYSISLSQTVLSITLYTLTFSVLIPVFGSLSKAIGFLRLFVGGMILVTISSLMCIFAPNYPIFLISRICIGVGVATVLPTIMGVISSYFPVEIQGKATGYWALVNSLGHAFGPSIGGFLLNHFAWQSIFWINIPLALISIILAIKVYPPDHRIPNKSFDWLGAGLMTGFVFSAMMAISLISNFENQKLLFFILSGTASVMLVLLLVREKRIENPFIDFELFKKKNYIASIAPISLQAFTQFGLLVSLPVFLIDINSVEKQISGLIIMSMTVMMAITSPFAGRLTDKWSSKYVCFIGTILVGLGSIIMFFFQTESLTTRGWLILIGSLMIFGTGFGTIQSGSTVAALQASPKEAAGAATGFFHMIRFLSASLGSTIFGLLLEENFKSATGGFYHSFILIMILSAITIPFTFWISSHNGSSQTSVKIQLD